MSPRPDRRQIACFDVFDTVLTRATGSPASVFLILGNELHTSGRIACTPEVFARLRVAAESTARRASSSGEVTLSDIYRTLQQSLHLDDAQRDHVAQMEMDLERSLIRPVPRTLPLIRQARKAGARVVFASDMYHSRDFITSLLRDAAAFEEGDLVFVSSEHGCNKHDGQLFRKIAEACGTTARSIAHYGNDPMADVRRPRRLGAAASRCGDCDLTRYEAILERHSFATGGLSSLLAGAARVTRIHLEHSKRYEPAIDDVAAGVISPFLVAYVSWVLQQAKRRNLASLYFVSRDGQIMLDVARTLAPRLGVDCDLRYLYGSRQAWHIAGLHSIEPSDFDWIFEAGDRLTIEMVLRRLHLSADDVADVLAAEGIRAAHLGAPLTAQHRAIVENLLSPGRPLADLVLGKAAEQRSLLLRYLEQQGVLAEPAWGLVDIGWRGRVQHSLERAIAGARATRPIGYYVGLDRGPSARGMTNAVAYLFDSPANGGWGRVPQGAAYIMEMFCQATHGMVTGYRVDQGRVIPVTNDVPTTARLEWGVRRIHDAVASCVDSLGADAGFLLGSSDLRSALHELFEEFWQRPSHAEAHRWGSFPYEDDQAGSIQKPLAASYTWSDTLSLAVSGRVPGRVVSWPAASFAMSNAAVRTTLQVARTLRTQAAFVKQMVAKPRSRPSPSSRPPISHSHSRP